MKTLVFILAVLPFACYASDEQTCTRLSMVVFSTAQARDVGQTKDEVITRSLKTLRGEYQTLDLDAWRVIRSLIDYTYRTPWLTPIDEAANVFQKCRKW